MDLSHSTVTLWIRDVCQARPPPVCILKAIHATLENIPLAPLTTFRLGGPARFFVEAHSPADVQEASRSRGPENLPLFVLGGGSNLVVADHGLARPGTAKLRSAGIERPPGSAGGKVVFEVGAGESWDRFGRRRRSRLRWRRMPERNSRQRRRNTGPKCGAYGQEVSETIESVRYSTSKTIRYGNCAGGLRFPLPLQHFQHDGTRAVRHSEVAYALTPAGQPHLEYADLKRHFEGRETSPSLTELREAVRDIRTRKGMLIVDGDPDSRSAGSFFKNPVVSEDQHRDLERRATAQGLTLPSYPALESRKKISAAWLVEHSGFHRGFILGRVGISSKHTLAMVNLGGATAVEILALKNLIQQRVDQTWGTKLEPEPVMVGF